MICNAEAASVEAASKQWAGKAHFVGVAWAGSDDDFQGFIDDHQLTFPQISDPDGAVFGRFQIPGNPAVAVVNLEGLVNQQLGAIEPAMLDEIITAAGR